MSYHNISTGGTPNSARQSTTNAQGQVAPIGFHYMPDGTLMSDIEHARLYGEKIISNFDLDLSSLPAVETVRYFNITGTDGGSFMLEIKNEDNYYYNFVTKSFQVAQTRLEDIITTQGYTGSITFPAITDDDQYDVYLFATPGTKHAQHTEVRFADNSVDINSSTGSNSLLIQKVIYQFATDLTLDLEFISPTSAIDIGSFEKASFTSPRGSRTNSSFSITCTVDSLANAYQIIKQPTIDDLLAYNSYAIEAAGYEDLPGEDTFPVLTSSTNTINGAVSAASRIVMDVAAVTAGQLVGDKITTATTSDTVDGAVSSGIKVVMDNNVAGKMSRGDRVTGNALLDSKLVTVAALNPDTDNVKEFSMSEHVPIDDGTTLTFSSIVNRSDVTVLAINPDDDNTFEISISDNVSLMDGITLNFGNRKNYQWATDNTSRLSTGQQIIMDLSSTNATSGSIISNYENSITRTDEYGGSVKVILDTAPAIDTKNSKPVVTRGEIVSQTGNIVFSKQQALAFGGGNFNIGGYGAEKILKVSGYKINLTNLAIAPVTITTTTTSAINDNLVVPVASVNGVVDGVTTVSGLGINASLADPKVVSRSVTSGAGDLTLDSIQTLEDDVTLTLAGAGQTVTITGNIEIIQSPPDSIPDGTTLRTLYFDVEKLLSIT
tara:strand:+ start:146 stop:2131 length:1986 start_codon:yes stop_codon:yes gene_type:complete